ncbi:MAG: four helix bundle protein [Rhodothermales bacterium]
MPTFRSFEEIDSWQAARVLTSVIYDLSSRSLLRNDVDLRRQLRRASVSIMSNIAEGYERGGRSEFIQFLSIAKGSCGEVRSQLYVAADAGYISQERLDDLLQQCQLIGRLLQGLIAHLQRAEGKGPKFEGRT